MEKEPKFEEKMSEEEKAAREKIIEIIENSKYYTPEVQKDFSAEEIIDKLELFDLPQFGFKNRLECISKDDDELELGRRMQTAEQKQDGFSYLGIMKAYTEKFWEEYNEKPNKDARKMGLNNFWAYIRSEEPPFGTFAGMETYENGKKVGHRNLQKFKNYIKEDFLRDGSLKKEELKKKLSDIFDKIFIGKAKSKAEKEMEEEILYFKTTMIHRVIGHALTEKAIKEVLGMTRQEFAHQLEQYFGSAKAREKIPPKEFAKGFIDSQNRLFDVYEQVCEWAGVKVEDGLWTG